MSEHFEVAIIGAGMSGLCAGIRAAHFGRKVVILEQHNAPGGLNSFYAKEGRKYDVGLHAMTNFAPASERRAILNKLLRQLRIDRRDLDLIEQKRSRIAFPEADICFCNDPELMETQVDSVFPLEAEGFRRLSAAVRAFPDADLTRPFSSARAWVRGYLTDPLLVDMLFCPLMYYGSSVEQDMDLGQFVVMFRSLFHEGFARPVDGIRVLIRVILDRYRKLGGIRRMKTAVSRLRVDRGRVSELLLENGDSIRADVVLSCAGLPETLALVQDDGAAPDDSHKAGRLAFAETIAIYREEPASWGWGEDAIVFFNQAPSFSYREAADPVDLRSGVICLPNNFRFGERRLDEGVVRVTCLANYDAWRAYPEQRYQDNKRAWFERMQQTIRTVMPEPSRRFLGDMVASDMFTPRTVKKFTRRARGAIYGAPEKVKDGSTPWENLFLCGTDQGYLGIVGSMLSGVIVANERVLKP